MIETLSNYGEQRFKPPKSVVPEAGLEPVRY